MYRIGQSSDIHKFKKGDHLIIGGEKIMAPYGVSAHSDGDALTHVIAEAILGALALGDLGHHFPDTDEKYKDANSLDLLKKVVTLMKQKGYVISNVDSLILIEKVKMAPHIEKIRSNLKEVLETDLGNISVKATRGEGIGFIGKEEGYMAQACVLLKKI